MFSIAQQTMLKDSRTLPDPAPYAAVTALSTGGVTVQARSIVNYPDYDRYMLDTRERLKKALEIDGVRLAEPHQRVYLEVPV